MLYKITSSVIRRMAPEWPSAELAHRFPWFVSPQSTRSSSASAPTRDGPEVGLMRAWLVFAGGIVLYTASTELVSPSRASFFDVNLRGDVDRQMAAAEAAAAREGRTTPGGPTTMPLTPQHARELTAADPAAASYAGGKHTMWWRVAQVRNDAVHGPNIAVPPFDNRVAGTTSSSL